MSLRRVLFNLTKTNSVSSLRFKNQKLYYFHVDKSNFPLIILTKALQYSSESPSKCWNCNFVYKSELFCSKCKVLQEPPENLTYFDIMGIPKSYDVTVSEVQKKYKELQKLLHPDKFSRKSEVGIINDNIRSQLINVFILIFTERKRTFRTFFIIGK